MAVATLASARLHCLREARAIIAAAVNVRAPADYWKLASALHLPPASATLADRIWREVNDGDSTVESEERALAQCEEMIRREMGR